MIREREGEKRSKRRQLGKEIGANALYTILRLFWINLMVTGHAEVFKAVILLDLHFRRYHRSKQKAGDRLEDHYNNTNKKQQEHKQG